MNVILGVGNELMGDDGIGPSIARKFEGRPGLFAAATAAPENFIRKVQELRPEILVIVDCANFGGRAGEHRMIKNNEITGLALSTHNTPLTLFLKAVHGHAGKIFIVGVQPKAVGFAEQMSREVSGSTSSIVWFLENLLKNGK
jgi:hydrogenase 3 maturation protease